MDIRFLKRKNLKKKIFIIHLLFRTKDRIKSRKRSKEEGSKVSKKKSKNNNTAKEERRPRDKEEETQVTKQTLLSAEEEEEEEEASGILHSISLFKLQMDRVTYRRGFYFTSLCFDDECMD